MDEVLHGPLGGTVEEEARVMLSEPIVATYKAYLLDLPLMLAKDVLRFLAHRLEKQADLLSALSVCKTFSEVIEVQGAFLDSALVDYSREARALLRDARRAVR
jgi:hypothetical protein